MRGFLLLWFLQQMAPIKVDVNLVNVAFTVRDARGDGREVQGPPRGPGSGESSQGEIDLMETWGSRPNRTAVHIHGTKGRTPSKTVQMDDMYGTFHLYAMEWYPDHMDFFLDKDKILTYSKDPESGWSFDHPMYLIMNIACGGPDEPAPDDSTLPQFMTVDYVRVYQKSPPAK